MGKGRRRKIPIQLRDGKEASWHRDHRRNNTTLLYYLRILGRFMHMHTKTHAFCCDRMRFCISFKDNHFFFLTYISKKQTLSPEARMDKQNTEAELFMIRR